MARRKAGIVDEDEGAPVTTAAPGRAKAGPAAHDLPRPPQAAIETAEMIGGIKGQTIPTTVYLLPDDHKRLRVLCAQVGLPAQELWQRGLDAVFAEHGLAPTSRYDNPRRRRRG
jgi:hypothetical protein